MDRIEDLVKEIKSWDRKDIKDLKSKLVELDELIFEDNNRNDPDEPRNLNDCIDISSLPTEPFNNLEGYEDYPIWAIDKNRMALVGEDLESIQSESEILECIFRLLGHRPKEKK